MKNWQKIVLGIVGLIVVVVAYGYLKIGRPLLAIGKSMAELAKLETLRITYESPDSKIKSIVEKGGKLEDGKLSRVFIEIPNQKIEARFGQELYLQGDTAEADKLTASIKKMDPSLVKTKTYTLLMPMLTGKNWLHVALPTEWWKVEDKSKKMDFEMSSPEGKKLAWRTLRTIKINKYERNFENQGVRYERVVFGLRKPGLLALIESIKDSDTSIKVSQINAMKRIVESNNDWDEDLLEFWIDRDGRLAKVMARLPEIDEKVMQESIKEGTQGEQSKAVIFETLRERLTGSTMPSKFVELGSVSLDEFNAVTPIAVPSPTTEWEAFRAQAMKDYGPLIMQIMGTMLGQPTPAIKR